MQFRFTDNTTGELHSYSEITNFHITRGVLTFTYEDGIITGMIDVKMSDIHGLVLASASEYDYLERPLYISMEDEGGIKFDYEINHVDYMLFTDIDVKVSYNVSDTEFITCKYMSEVNDYFWLKEKFEITY